MEPLVAYGHALTALALWAVLVIVLSPVSVQTRTAGSESASGKPRKDYSDRGYRADRALMNAVETSGSFIAATLAAILAGATPFWVNLLASLFILARVAMAYVHIMTVNATLRSALWAVGTLCILGLALMAIGAVFL